MCKAIRGTKEKRMFCCCSVKIGAHIVGFVSLLLFFYYMFLLIRSSRHDNFEWRILIWCFVIGVVRVATWVLLIVKQNDAFGRRMFAFALIGTTVVEAVLFGVIQGTQHQDNAEYCKEVYAVNHMVSVWGLTCGGAAFLYTLGMVASLTFYIFASIAACDFALKKDQQQKENEEVKNMAEKSHNQLLE